MFFTYLRRELRRRRKAALVVALGLALGIGLVITVSSVSAGMRDAQDEVLKSLYGVGTDITVSRQADADGERPARPRLRFDQRGEGETESSKEVVVPAGGLAALDESAVREVARQDGVASAVGGLSLTVNKLNGSFRIEPGQQPPGGPGSSGKGGPDVVERGHGSAEFDVDSYTLFGVDVSDQGVGPMSSVGISEGKGFTAAQADAAVAVLDSGYARQEKLDVGDTLTIKGAEYEIVGIATADTGEPAANVYVPLARAQALADVDMKDKVSTVYVKAEDADRVGAVKSAIEKNVTGTTVTSSSDLAEQVSGSLSTASDLATSIGKWLSAVVLAAAFLIAALLTGSAVTRRVREFGTLKAVGWSRGRVVRQVVGEAFAGGALGGALGIALGVAGALAVTAVAPGLTATVGATGATGAGPGGPGGFGGPRVLGEKTAKSIDIALTAPLTATTIALAVLLAVTGGLVAGAFGGWRAARLRPADALRRIE
ncbi:ABC transporter permease [Streptomyces capparidis]